MSTKHTPGPWHRRIGRVGNGTLASQHEQICNTEGIAVAMLEHDGCADGAANVVLMTAAPELLEACERAMGTQDWTGPRTLTYDDVAVLRAAIAKAQGETK